MARCPRCALDLNAAFAAASAAGATVVGDELSSDEFAALSNPDATMVDPEEAPTTAAEVPDTGEELAHRPREVDTDERGVPGLLQEDSDLDTDERLALPELLQPGGEVITDKRVAFEAVEAARALSAPALPMSAPPVEERPKSRPGMAGVTAGPGARRTITGEQPLNPAKRGAVPSNPGAKRAAVPHEGTPAPRKSALHVPTGAAQTKDGDAPADLRGNGAAEHRSESVRVEPAALRPDPVPPPNPRKASTQGGGRVTDSLINAQLGEYIIAERVGVGGMGIVYRAKQPLIGTNVAIKVLRPDVLADPRDVERLLHEAKVVNQIKHRGIINIFGAGSLPDGRQYLVMEYLEGETLEHRLEREGRLKPEVVVPILDEVLAALGAAHDAGIVHRDLKPANVFLIKQSDGRPWVKLLDFGLARRNTNDVSRIAGTPDYISPEHARGRPAGPPTDIYAVGILAFHLLTGQLPFKGNTPMEVMEKHVHSPPPDPASINPDIHPVLAGFALKLLEKDPAKRPDAKQARKDLKAAFKDLNFSSHLNLEPVSPSSVMPDQPLVGTVNVSASDVDPRLRDLARRADRAKLLRLAVQHWPWIAGVVAILWVLGVAVYLIATPSPTAPLPKALPLKPKLSEHHGPPGPPEPIPRPDSQAHPADEAHAAPRPTDEPKPEPAKPDEAKPDEAKPAEAAAPPDEAHPAEEPKPAEPAHAEEHKARPKDPEAQRKKLLEDIDFFQKQRLDDHTVTLYGPALQRLHDQTVAAEPAELPGLAQKLEEVKQKIRDASP